MQNGASITGERACHWIKKNHQNRIPKRWISFDTEANSETRDNLEIQTWKMGAAIRWRTDLKTGDHAEHSTFDDPVSFWKWITDYCAVGQRTVCIAHNLGYDSRISDVFQILPNLGFRLEWCNLDSNVSSMTWRSDKGTLVFCDLWTWLPVKLHQVGIDVDLPKLLMPPKSADANAWNQYCGRDAEIVYKAMSEILAYVRDEDLGNWQPTGAGMAYAAWRHKFVSHKILVHDDLDILAAERQAMYTGRAEAWRHGEFLGDTWTEVDMRNAYVTIASECDLPTKLKYRTGAIDNGAFDSLRGVYRCLVYARVCTSVPALPCVSDNRIVWPVGTFEGWWWDTEIVCAQEFGAEVQIKDCICYTKHPILRDWARWILSILDPNNDAVSPVIKTWLKHCGRALIGRLSLRTPTWAPYADNPFHDTGITWETNADTGESYRLMSVGDTVFRETERKEYKDSLPQVTGYIMALCRHRLFDVMSIVGFDNIAHVDTDSILVNATGLANLRNAQLLEFDRYWHIKASYNRLLIYGPRNYRPGKLRKTAGVPKTAVESEPNVFMGESWHGIATDFENGRPDKVTIETRPYKLRTEDPRRLDAPGAPGQTVARSVYQISSRSTASTAGAGSGE